MNLTSLQSDCRFLIFGNSSDTSYGTTDLNRNINRWYNTAVAWIIGANGDWQVNGEVATSDLVAGQKEYIMPVDLLKINEVYVKINGEYEKATAFDPSELGVEPDSFTPSSPYYDLQDNSLFIYTPGTIVTTTDGLKIHYQTEIVSELSASGDNPNIAENFRRLLSVGAAYDYCIANEMYNKSKKLEDMIFQVLKPDLIKYYSTKNTKPTRLVPKETNYR